LEILFGDWEILSQRNITGPVTLALVCGIEFFSTLFSFGREKAKAYAYLLLCVLLFPLKYLDVLFVGRRMFLSLAPTILTVVRKQDGKPAA
jgi:hypothetical protein